MKRARIATPIVILGITIAASVFVLTRPRPSPFSPDGTVAIECAGVITHAYDSSVIYACRCKAAEGGELFLDRVKIADVPPSTGWHGPHGDFDCDELRPVRGLFELRSGRTVVMLRGDVLRR